MTLVPVPSKLGTHWSPLFCFDLSPPRMVSCPPRPARMQCVSEQLSLCWPGGSCRVAWWGLLVQLEHPSCLH